MTALELLEQTRELVEDHWGKHTYYDPVMDTYCLSGALSYAAFGDPHLIEGTNVSVWSTARNSIYELAREAGFSGIVAFNDCSRITHQQVLDLLDSAIEKTKEEEEVLVAA